MKKAKRVFNVAVFTLVILLFFDFPAAADTGSNCSPERLKYFLLGVLAGGLLPRLAEELPHSVLAALNRRKKLKRYSITELEMNRQYRFGTPVTAQCFFYPRESTTGREEELEFLAGKYIGRQHDLLFFEVHIDGCKGVFRVSENRLLIDGNKVLYPAEE